ncbi:MAG: isoprenyl transferase [Eubacterium sp.]|nr:isoprenyl transferase [Eubacterium sp.]
MGLQDYRIDQNNMPKHVAIIMDGNGRWAKQRKRPRLFGHNAGMKALHKVVHTASDLGIEVLTVYAFSTENWKRSQEEVDGLMKIAVEYFMKEIAELHANRVQVRIIGERSRLPEAVRKSAAEAEDLTKDNDGLILNVALNYGGRDEIVHAVKSIVAEGIAPEDVDEEMISKRLYTADIPDPDIMIRTGGEKRLSNFMLWQNAYAEFFFDDIWWPDFDEDALYRIIEAYQNRDRRFGAV